MYTHAEKDDTVLKALNIAGLIQSTLSEVPIERRIEFISIISTRVDKLIKSLDSNFGDHNDFRSQ